MGGTRERVEREREVYIYILREIENKRESKRERERESKRGRENARENARVRM